VNPAADLVNALKRQLESNITMLHQNPAYLAHEARRLAAYADTQDTARQLARYGVTLGEP
jgi:hypothetical protein